MKFRTVPPILAYVIAFALLMCLCPGNIYGQFYKKRTYANFQGVYRTGLYALGGETVFGSIANAPLAADSDPRTASTMEIPVNLVGLATITQFLEFTTNGTHSTARTISAGTPVAVKFKIPSSVLGLLSGVEIGTYTNLNAVSQSISGVLGTGPGNSAGYNATNKYPLYSGSSLLNALNGAGELELILTPAQAYNGVYIKLSGNGLSIALSTDVFHAYILEDAPLNCSTINKVVDVLSGVKGNPLINAASATGNVTSAWNAVDNDPSLSTFSTLSTGAQVLSNVFETAIFETPSKPGDSVRMVIQDPGGGLLNLEALKGFAIQPYLGNTPVGSPITSSSLLVSLKLLSGPSNKYELSVAIPQSFDRVEIVMGGVADALSALRIYNIERVIPAPVITSNAVDVTSDTVFVYQGNSLELTGTAPNGSDVIRWYDANGQLVGSGNSYYIPSVLADGMYYAESSRNGCTEMSSRHSVYIKTLSPLMLSLTMRQTAGRHRENKNDMLDIMVQNPVKETIKVSFNGMKKGKYQVQINSIGGFAVCNTQFSIYSSQHALVLPRPLQSAPGLYIISIYNEMKERVQSFKVIFR